MRSECVWACRRACRCACSRRVADVQCACSVQWVCGGRQVHTEAATSVGQQGAVEACLLTGLLVLLVVRLLLREGGRR